MTANPDSAPCWLLLAESSAISPPSPHDWLTPSEQRRLQQLGAVRRQQSFLYGHYLLRLALSEYLGGTPLQWQVEQRDSGRLWLSNDGYQHIGVSLSHSGDWFACAIAVGPVGVDIEQIKPRVALADMVESYGSPALQQRWQVLPEAQRLREWYRWWCCYESGVKQQGRGIDLAEFGKMRLLLVATDGGEASAASRLEKAASFHHSGSICWSLRFDHLMLAVTTASACRLFAPRWLSGRQKLPDPEGTSADSERWLLILE